jgi:N6-L-threonylcarbamoyladenine synthase
MKTLPRTALSIETSCDETAFAYFEIENSQAQLIAASVYSQADEHSKYGGVVPHMAARLHHKKIPIVFHEMVSQVRGKGIDFSPEVIFVTDGPGLSPSLWTGVNQAVILGEALGVPVYGVNHMHGHLFSGLFSHESQSFELSSEIENSLGVLISGGHTDFLAIKKWGEYQWLGGTQDDAIGEAFDKVAKMLGLGYPGGPIVSKKATHGDSGAYDFPLPMLHSKDLMMSYSGLKTAVLYTIQDYQKSHEELDEKFIADVCASFQRAAVDVLVKKITFAIEQEHPEKVFIGGGVIANPYLKSQLEILSEKTGVELVAAQGVLTSDNAIMIGMAGILHLYHGVALQPPVVQSSLGSDEL